MRLTNKALVVAFVAGLLASPTAVHAGVEEELLELRKQVADIKKELAEIKSMLHSTLKPQRLATTTATVSVSGRPSLGNRDAPVTLVEFSDYQCPFCKRHFSTTFPFLKKDYIDTGKLRYVFRDFPIDGLHPAAKKAHEAAHCAGEQNRYWEMHDILFENPKDFSIPALKTYAMNIALNGDQFNDCLDSGKYAGDVHREVAEGITAGVRGTPAFLIGPTGSGEQITGTMLNGAQPLARFKQLIDHSLNLASQTGGSKPK